MAKTQKVTVEHKKKPADKGEFTGLGLAAYVLMIIVTVGCSFALIPLAWTIPMTISVKRNYKLYDKPCSTALMVCTLLFMGIIPGILLLVDEHNKKKSK